MPLFNFDACVVKTTCQFSCSVILPFNIRKDEVDSVSKINMHYFPSKLYFSKLSIEYMDIEKLIL